MEARAKRYGDLVNQQSMAISLRQLEDKLRIHQPLTSEEQKRLHELQAERARIRESTVAGGVTH